MKNIKKRKKLKLHILYVEDEPNDQLIMKHALKKLPIDYDLTTVSTGREGLNEVEKKKFDLLLLDYMLPAMSGIELLNELQKRKVYTPIIFVTSKGSEKVAVEAIKLGVIDYIVKDEIGTNRLTDSITEIIGTRTKAIKSFNKRFIFYLVFAVVYGLVFINYIDVITGGYEGYHLWLVIMYFFPFATLTMIFPRNLQLTLGLGLLVSLMNDVFYGVIRSMMGLPLDLGWYYHNWLVPTDTLLFTLNLGFAIIPVYSWMMALTIYLRIILVFILLRMWYIPAKIRYINQAQIIKKDKKATTASV
ncbi:MAG: response regulator [Candidatus Bathyarchaeota archaeon]|nr:response regulator [Candidatus Bathyarchaeota archaeon]